MRKNFLIALLSLCLCFGFLLVAGCSAFKPHRVDIQQGNILDQDDADKVRLGMMKKEVEDILGEPVLTSGFDENCATYVYTNQINGGKVEEKQLILYYKNGRLLRMDKNGIVTINEKKSKR